MKTFVFLLMASSSLGLSKLSAGVCPQLGPDLLPDTFITGSGPIPANAEPEWAQECMEVGLGFTLMGCGSFDARPTCECSNGDVWRHPYFYGACADGANPTKCNCPNGNDFPVA